MGVSERIKAIREVKRIKQIDVAATLNLDPSYYARLEKRGEKMSIEQLQSIADALGVSLGELLGTDDKVIEIETSSSSKEMEKRIKELEDYLKIFQEILKVYTENSNFLGKNLIYRVQSEILKTAFELEILTENKQNEWLLERPILVDDERYLISISGLLRKKIDIDKFFLSKFLDSDQIVKCFSNSYSNPIVLEAFLVLDRFGLIDDEEVSKAVIKFFHTPFKRFKNPFEAPPF